MIKYNLICECEKTFESWFSTASEYEHLFKKKLINCIYCGSFKVKKSLMAPNLNSKSNKLNGQTKSEKKIKKQLLDFRKYIEKNCKDVGANFSKEARNMHYDKKSSKGIYGKASKKETEELLEEGIEITTIPWVDKSEN